MIYERGIVSSLRNWHGGSLMNYYITPNDTGCWNVLFQKTELPSSEWKARGFYPTMTIEQARTVARRRNAEDADYVQNLRRLARTEKKIVSH